VKLVSLRLWLFFTPLSYVFVLVFHQGIKGIWCAETISFAVFLPITFKRLKSQELGRIEA
jgi:Na+-driven multidrug efflux pump